MSAEFAAAVRAASRKLFGAYPKGNTLRTGRKVLRKHSKARYMAEYYPRTVEWMKFKEYVYADYEFIVEQEKENARLGITKRSRGDGKSKRGMQ